MRLTLQSNYFYNHENLENTTIPTRNNDIFQQDEIAQISKLGLKIMLIALSLLPLNTYLQNSRSWVLNKTCIKVGEWLQFLITSPHKHFNIVTRESCSRYLFTLLTTIPIWRTHKTSIENFLIAWLINKRGSRWLQYLLISHGSAAAGWAILRPV